MPDQRPTYLAPAEAARAILADIAPLPMESVSLPNALDRILARDITRPVDIPPWDNSAMDGYAVRSQDVVGAAGNELRIVEVIPAGAFPTRAIGPGECARIFTGAPIPEGADSVIRQEDTTPLDGDRVRINDDRDSGRNVRGRGEDIRHNAVALTAGTALGPAQLGVLASIAMSEVPVRGRPTVATLTSGDELVDLEERDQILSGRKIISSNSYTMLAMAQHAGAEVLNLGIAQDDAEVLRARLRDAADADLLVTSGGMSVGQHDYFRSILEEAGAAMKFWRIRMRPGAPVGFGLLDGLPWVGLPGNPVSTMVTFELFVRPAIRKLLGHTRLFRRAVPVRVGEPITTPAPLQHFLRVRLTDEAGELTARLTGPQGSGILLSMAKADALLIVPEERDEIAVGDMLDAIVFGDGIHVEGVPF